MTVEIKQFKRKQSLKARRSDIFGSEDQGKFINELKEEKKNWK